MYLKSNVFLRQASNMQSIFVTTTFIVMLFCIGADSAATRGNCEHDEEYDPCPTKCPATCDNLSPSECDYGCGARKCVCVSGYVLMSEEMRVCVKRSRCPRRCDAPKIYSGCATNCPATCDEPNPRVCDRACNTRVECVCPRNMVQVSAKNTTCVKLWECPGKCDRNEVFSACPTLCPRSCDDERNQRCSNECGKPQCVCKEGYVRRSMKNPRCVRESECPARCENPKVYTECATNCPPTCDNPNPGACTRACNTAVSCQCPRNMVQISDKDTTCVKDSQCPARCEHPKVYTECATNCPPTCDDPNPGDCNRSCNTAVSCECPRNMVQISHKDTTCVKDSQCPDHSDPVDCELSPWKPVKNCMELNGGVWVRQYKRTVVRDSKNGGRRCSSWRKNYRFCENGKF